MRVKSGEQRRARGTAARGVVELRELQPALGERIEIRRRNLRAVTAQIRPAHVIHEDDNDVGFGPHHLHLPSGCLHI